MSDIFLRIKNDNAGADVPHFLLPDKSDILRTPDDVKKYMEYRNQYHSVLNVFPELDKVHSPVCAVLFNYVIMPEDTKKDHIKSFAKTGAKAALGAMMTGFNLGGGPVSAGDMNDIGQGVVALYSAPWYSAFQKEFQASVEKYKYLYSLVSSIDLTYFMQLPEGENISEDGLGYRKDEEGYYYEGTWRGGVISYGMVVNPEGAVFAGLFDANGDLDEGVCIMRDSTYIGVYTNGDLDCQHGIRIDRNKPGYEFVVFTGPFLEGIPNGTIYVYSKETNGNVYVDGVQYEKGVEKKVSTVRKMLGLYIPQEQKENRKKFFKTYLVACAFLVFLFLIGATGKISSLMLGAAFFVTIVALVVLWFLNKKDREIYKKCNKLFLIICAAMALIMIAYMISPILSVVLILALAVVVFLYIKKMRK